MTERAVPVTDVRTLTGLRSVGGVVPADLIAAVVAGADLPGLGSDDYHLELGVTAKEAANRAWAVLGGAWAAYRDALATRPTGDPATGLTRERWLSVLLRELGFGRVPPTPSGGLIADGRSWPVSHQVGAYLPIHLLGWDVDLDRRTPGMAGAAERAPHGMVQELLNRSDEFLYALLANGSTLRILRDSSTLTGPSYVEFDLAAIFDGDLFSDFVALYLLCHQSRFEPTDPELGPVSCWLEQWRSHAVEAGARALGALRIGVHDAIETIGTGLVANPANASLREALDGGHLEAIDLQRGLLRLVYRILFCFVAEDRDLLLDAEADPLAKARYRQWFSTARLRRIAIRRSGDGHADLWQALHLVLGSLGQEEGCPGLGLVGLGGIFEPEPTDLGPELVLDNRSLLAAVRHLCITRPIANGPRRVVDYRHLGAEELGGIYESLLEYVPRYEPSSRTFALESSAGNDRKKTGAYYTPSSLTETLLDSALDPLLDRAEAESDPVAALLALTVCDPACGSGHFLVAAGRRIAGRVAARRADGAEPTIDDLHVAMHDVVAHCLYGVDVNPLAAELAKVSLWLEGMQSGRPLSLLDGHIKIGNALLGATPALLAGGIPDDAFAVIEGDDKKTCSSLKKRNKSERAGQGSFEQVNIAAARTAAFGADLAAIDALSPQSLADVHDAARRLRVLDESPVVRQARREADAWCSAFVIPKVPGAPELTESTLARVNDGSAPGDLMESVADLTARYRWFHWHLEFPQIFIRGDETDGDAVTGWTGGFDCVIGNPPWERVKLQEQEWFASRLPAIAEARNAAARKKLIATLASDRPLLYREFLTARRQAEGESHFIRNSGRNPLAGRGDINTYAVFAETDRALLAGTGRLGVILPTGIATDATTQYFFKDLVKSRALVALYDFENALPLFEGVHRSFKFCLLTLNGRDEPIDAAWFAFFAHHPDDLQREEGRFRLTPEEITLLNPNTGTCPVFRTRRDAEITLDIYRRHPVLTRHDGSDGNPWGLSFMTMFHMSNDSGLFRTREQLEVDGWKLLGNVFHRGGETMLPLYQGVMIDFYDHRAADVVRSVTAVKRQNQPSYISDTEKADAHRVALPIYWVESEKVIAQLSDRWSRHWLSGFSRVTSPTNMRTMVPTLIPFAGVGDNIFMMLADRSPVLLNALMSSVPFDYVTRQKVGGLNMNFFYVEQLPALMPDTFSENCSWAVGTVQSWVQSRIVELTYTAWDMAPVGRELGYEGPPFIWEPERRVVLKAELDSAFFHLYGIHRADTEYILSTFPIANRKDPDLASRVLDAYDRIAEAERTAQPFVSTLDPPPGHGPRHPETT
jgi:hypothetical protein